MTATAAGAPEQSQSAARCALMRAVRSERAAVRQQIQTRQLTLQDVMRNPPESLQSRLLSDVVLMFRRKARDPHMTMAVMGAFAVRDAVNLTQPLGIASAYARAWVADYDPWSTGRDPEDHHA